MTNEQMNAKADEIAERVKRAAESGESPQDLANLVFVNVKAALAEATRKL